VTTGVVLVTGASSGIGEAFARRIAREPDRRDLALVARRRDRLETLARELETRHDRRVHVLPCDLVEPGAPASLLSELERRGLHVEWLVNNAAFGSSGRFDRLPLARELEMVRLNVGALVELTGRVLPAMVARGDGLVVNVASVAAFGPMGNTATYGATKAFVLAFSESIAVELDGTGVEVLCVCPGFTRTEFQDVAGMKGARAPAMAWMTAEDVADRAVAAIGTRTVVVTGFLNTVATVGMRLAPRRWVAWATGRAAR